MPLVLLLLGAGGLYWWLRQHQSTPAPAPTTTGWLPATRSTAMVPWQAHAMALAVNPAIHAQALPNGASDGGLAAHAAAAASPVPTNVDWSVLLMNMASAVTIVTAVAGESGPEPTEAEQDMDQLGPQLSHK